MITKKLCELDELEPGQVQAFEVDGREVLLARIDGQWFALDDTCSHAKVSLAEGILEEDDLTIECPKHGALFSLESGEALTLPATRGVAAHATEVREDGVYVTITEEES